MTSISLPEDLLLIHNQWVSKMYFVGKYFSSTESDKSDMV